MFCEQIGINKAITCIILLIRILYNSKFILMVTSLGTPGVVVTRVHCITIQIFGHMRAYMHFSPRKAFFFHLSSFFFLFSSFFFKTYAQTNMVRKQTRAFCWSFEETSNTHLYCCQTWSFQALLTLQLVNLYMSTTLMLGKKFSRRRFNFIFYFIIINIFFQKIGFDNSFKMSRLVF